MNRWKTVAILLGATSIFWLVLSFSFIAYSLSNYVTTWPITWLIVFGAPCSAGCYVSYRCVKKSRNIVKKKMELNIHPSLRIPSAPPPVDQSICKCPSCGAEIWGEVFCSKCGSKIAEIRKLEATMLYYKRRGTRAAILAAIMAFWVLVVFYIPFDWQALFYSFMIAFVGAIYYSLVFLYSGFKVVTLKRKRKKRN